MSASEEDIEKKGVTAVAPASDGTTPAYGDAVADEHGVGEVSPLKRSLQGRHMQMIAIGLFLSPLDMQRR
jgi:amino acid permease